MARTPSSSCAQDVSMLLMRAWAYGLRTIAAWTMLGRWTSSTNNAWPVSSLGSSLRLIRSPKNRVAIQFLLLASDAGSPGSGNYYPSSGLFAQIELNAQWTVKTHETCTAMVLVMAHQLVNLTAQRPLVKTSGMKLTLAYRWRIIVCRWWRKGWNQKHHRQRTRVCLD